MQSIEKWTEVKAPIDRVFNLFANFESFPKWLSHVGEVRRIDNRLILWQATDVNGISINWETEAIIDEADRRIVWRTVRGAVNSFGEATFEETKRGTTLMRLLIGYGASPEGGSHQAASNLYKLVQNNLEADLNRFKSMAQRSETSAVVATHGATLSATGLPSAASSVVVPKKDEQQTTLVRDFITVDEAAHKGASQYSLPTQSNLQVNTNQPSPESTASYDPDETLMYYKPVISEGHKHTAANIGSGSAVAAASAKAHEARASSPVDYARPSPPIVIDVEKKETEPAYTRTLNRSPLVLAGLAVAALALLALGLFWLARQRSQTVSPAAAPNAMTASAPATTQPSLAIPSNTSLTAPSPAVPPEVRTSRAVVTSRRDSSPATDTSDSSSPTAPPIRSAASDPSRTNVSADAERTTLRSMLNDWISATNVRDLDRQMAFYSPVVQRYYRGHYVSLKAVREEKRRRFARADAIQITVSDPTITFSSNNRTATMRFRKQYVLGRGPQAEHGEVLQELIWLKTEDGWRIISERDIQVLS